MSFPSSSWFMLVGEARAGDRLGPVFQKSLSGSNWSTFVMFCCPGSPDPDYFLPVFKGTLDWITVIQTPHFRITEMWCHPPFFRSLVCLVKVDSDILRAEYIKKFCSSTMKLCFFSSTSHTELYWGLLPRPSTLYFTTRGKTLIRHDKTHPDPPSSDVTHGRVQIFTG